MQSTENTTETRLSPEQIEGIQARATSAANYGNQGFFVDSLMVVSEKDVPALIVALAAERDRADRAEAALEDAPHDSACDGWTPVGDGDDHMDDAECDCWKSEATA